MGWSASSGRGLKSAGWRSFHRADVVAHDDHPHAELGALEQALGEADRHADAAVRRRMAGQHARMQGDARPGETLHEGHRRVVVEIGVVLDLPLEHAEDPGRCLVAGLARRDGRLQDLPFAVVDGDALLIERDDRHHGRGGGTRDGRSVIAASSAFRKGIGGRAAEESRKTDAGEGGRAELEPGRYAATVAGHPSASFGTRHRPDRHRLSYRAGPKQVLAQAGPAPNV